jgi:light-regulated signal transduction histidine kinase (bacteriophytochrome)
LDQPFHQPQDPQSLIRLLQNELSTTNHEVMVLTLELEQRVAERTAQLSIANQELMSEILERRHAEEEIKRLNQHLQHRAKLLQEANEELEAFTGSVSHDLRNPLSVIVGFASLLEADASPILSEEGRLCLDKIKTAAKNMTNLIDELLRFSRCAHTELLRKQTDLNSVVDSAIVDLDISIRGRNIVWKRTPLPSVGCDVALLKQVFVNLISNALKYTRQRDVAEIEVSFATSAPGELVFLVRDNGVGFDPRQTDKLFGMFKRLHSSEDFEGTGIGLANVRRIVSRHGGRTWAEGRPGEGATFYFTLPESASVVEAKTMSA